MKRILLVALVVLFSSSVAFAQLDNGHIGIFADVAGTNCNLSGAPGPLTVYFLHVNAYAVLYSQWAAPHPTCLPAEHIADAPGYPSVILIGDTETGITVGYGPRCMEGTFLIVTATYNVSAPSSECCRWSVVPDPSNPTGKIEVGDCWFDWTFPSGGQAIINATPSCTCSVPVEKTSWGRVKALYAE